MKTKTIQVTSILPFSEDVIWENLMLFSTLKYITAPFATFTPINDVIVWKEGEVFRFHLRLFGFIPMGVHEIKVIECNRETLSVYTHESNPRVPVWNHRILLEPCNDRTVRYTDEVEIQARWATPIVVVWSRVFYRHRQRKWKSLLEHQTRQSN